MMSGLYTVLTKSIGSRSRANSYSHPSPARAFSPPSLPKVSETPTNQPAPPPKPSTSTPLHPVKSTPYSPAPCTKAPQTSMPELRKVKSASASSAKSPSRSFGKKTSWLLSKFKSSPKVAPASPVMPSSPVPKKSKVSNGTVSPPQSTVPQTLIQGPQPSLAKLSPELATASRTNTNEEISALALDEPEKSGFLMNTLRRFKSNVDSPQVTPDTSIYHFDHTPLNHTVDRPVYNIPEIENVPTARVTFSADTFYIDPPQQIPSKKPKPGVVVVDDNGVVSRPERPSSLYTPVKNYQAAATAATNAALNSAALTASAVKSDRTEKKHRILSRHTVQTPGGPVVEEEEEDEEDDEEPLEEEKTNIGKAAQGLNIDKVSATNKSPGNGSAEKQLKCEWTDIYTRCCHLREIMPIRATLNQLEGKSGTLTYLRLLNPRPTLIEVLAFSDFISIAPINTVALNRIDITEEMFKHLILALTHSTALLKLSLKNVDLTPRNWRILCAFLVTNRSLRKLDISIADPSEYTQKTCKYYQIDLFDRAKLDWSLLTKAIIARGGIEELIINGCLVPHKQFKELMSTACSIATKRLGVAYSDLEAEDLIALGDWTLNNPNCEGLDLGGNDLSQSESLLRTIFTNSNVLCLSINSCNLKSADIVGEILKNSCETSRMVFLDASFNPGLFPQLTTAINLYLPKLKELRRVQFDHNNLTSQDVITMAEAFAKCQLLSHVTLRGNQDINKAAAEALATAVKLSSSMTRVDIDPNVIPENIQRRLSHYCMENIEALLHRDHDVLKFDEDDDEGELLDNGTELANAVAYVVDKNKTTPTSGLEDPMHNDRCPLLIDGLAQRATVVRQRVISRIHQIIDNSMKKPNLNMDVKDKLIKLYFLDESLQHVLNRYNMFKSHIAKPSDSETPKEDETINGASRKVSSMPLRQLDQADSMMEIVKNRRNSTSSSLPTRSPSTSSLAESVKAVPNAPPMRAQPTAPPREAHYHPTEDDDVHILRSSSSRNPAMREIRKQEREEGDFYKLSAFMKSKKNAEYEMGNVADEKTLQSIQQLEQASGETIRKLLMGKGEGAESKAAAPEQAIESESQTPDIQSSNEDDSSSTSSDDERVNVDGLIQQLKNMSPKETLEYLTQKYQHATSPATDQGVVTPEPN